MTAVMPSTQFTATLNSFWRELPHAPAFGCKFAGTRPSGEDLGLRHSFNHLRHGLAKYSRVLAHNSVIITRYSPMFLSIPARTVFRPPIGDRRNAARNRVERGKD